MHTPRDHAHLTASARCNKSVATTLTWCCCMHAVPTNRQAAVSRPHAEHVVVAPRECIAQAHEYTLYEFRMDCMDFAWQEQTRIFTQAHACTLYMNFVLILYVARTYCTSTCIHSLHELCMHVAWRTYICSTTTPCVDAYSLQVGEGLNLRYLG